MHCISSTSKWVFVIMEHAEARASRPLDAAETAALAESRKVI